MSTAVSRELPRSGDLRQGKQDERGDETVQCEPAEPLVSGASRTSRGFGTHSPVAGREHTLFFHTGVSFILPEVGLLKTICFLSFFFFLIA